MTQVFGYRTNARWGTSGGDTGRQWLGENHVPLMLLQDLASHVGMMPIRGMYDT
jgi:hypothetical protein